MGDLAATFLGGGFFTLVDDEMFESTEEVGAEAGAIWFEGGKGIAGEERGEKAVGEVAGGVIIAAFFFKEGDDGGVVGVGEFAEGLAGVRGVASGGDDASRVQRRKGI